VSKILNRISRKLIDSTKLKYRIWVTPAEALGRRQQDFVPLRALPLPRWNSLVFDLEIFVFVLIL
jgi:hypothetical protein